MLFAVVQLILLISFNFFFHSVTSLVAIQLCSSNCWHVDRSYCRTRLRQSCLKFILSPLLLLLHMLVMLQSDIFFLCLLGQLNQGWESTPRLHVYLMGHVFTNAIAISADRQMVVYNGHIQHMTKMFDIPWIERKHQSNCPCIVEFIHIRWRFGQTIVYGMHDIA